MKNILFYFVLLFYFCANAQVDPPPYKILADTVIMQSFDGSSEFKLENATRSLDGAVLTNVGDGLTEFQPFLKDTVACWYTLRTRPVLSEYSDLPVFGNFDYGPSSAIRWSYGFVPKFDADLIALGWAYDSVDLGAINASAIIRLYDEDWNTIMTRSINTQGLNVYRIPYDPDGVVWLYQDISFSSPSSYTLEAGKKYYISMAYNGVPTILRRQAPSIVPPPFFNPDIEIIDFYADNNATGPGTPSGGTQPFGGFADMIIKAKEITCEKLFPDFVVDAGALNDSTLFFARVSTDTSKVDIANHDLIWYPNFIEFTGDNGSKTITNVFSIGNNVHPSFSGGNTSQVEAGVKGVYIHEGPRNSWHFGRTTYGVAQVQQHRTQRDYSVSFFDPQSSPLSPNILIGERAGQNVENGDNIAIGAHSLRGTWQSLNPDDGGSNIAIGTQAMGAGISQVENVALGHKAHFENWGWWPSGGCQSCQNVALGAFAGERMYTGVQNTFAGAFTGQYSFGSRNAFVGAKAGQFNGQGYNNTYIGFEAGKYTGWGRNNIFIGYQAGKNAPNNTQDELWIHNSDDPNPLVWGHFTQRIFRINGLLEVFNGDAYIRTVGRGVILKSPDTNCHKVQVDNAGVLSTIPVACP